MTGVNKISQTGVGSSSVYQVNYLIVPFILSMHTTVTGTATYTVEQTMDDVLANDFNPATARWAGIATALTNATTNRPLYTATPARGIRVSVTSGTGTVSVTFCQSGAG